jgi:ankyrin repeat protein
LGHTDVVICLLSHGAKLNVRNNAGDLPVHIAATEEIKQIIRDEEQRRRDVVRSRVSASQDAAAANARLLAAVKRGDIDAVRSSCAEANVDINLPHQSERGGTALYVAAQKGHLEVVQRLVQHGADKDRATYDGWTPLFTAAEQGRLAVVQYLVQLGADKDQAGNLGWTPLWIAAARGCFEVVQYLVQQGADKEKADNSGRTPLWIVTWRWCSG